MCHYPINPVGGEGVGAEIPLNQEEWLDDKEARRDEVIMELRRLERTLIRYGRLKRESLPRRIR